MSLRVYSEWCVANGRYEVVRVCVLIMLFKA